LVAEPFATNVTALLAGDPGQWVITCGKRDRATELAGWRRFLADPTQPKFTNPDNSAHCADPHALAVDITLVSGAADDWDYRDAAWRRIVAAVDASEHLHSLDSIGDTDHIEQSNWRAFVGT
jgi:hypothetical protein